MNILKIVLMLYGVGVIDVGVWKLVEKKKYVVLMKKDK
jgi:hypothetical protein